MYLLYVPSEQYIAEYIIVTKTITSKKFISEHFLAVTYCFYLSLTQFHVIM